MVPTSAASSDRILHLNENDVLVRVLAVLNFRLRM